MLLSFPPFYGWEFGDNNENQYDVTQDDAGVDYAAMRKSTGFAEYSALAKDLGDEDLDLGTMSEIGTDRAFFIMCNPSGD